MRALKGVIIILGFLIYTAGVFYWFEAEKEVRILCSMFQEGQSAASVQQTLDTGNLLSYSVNSDAIAVNSMCTLNTSECIVSLSNSETVTSSVYNQYFRLEKAAGIIAASLTFLLAGFQLLLALGVPWGEFAWGGFYKKLPKSLRIGSFVSFVLLIVGVLSVLSATDLINLMSKTLYVVIVPLLTLLFLGSVAGNFNSSSKKEKMVMIPVSIILFCTCLIVSVYIFG